MACLAIAAAGLSMHLPRPLVLQASLQKTMSSAGATTSVAMSTRAARVRQLALEREHGEDFDVVAERGDGEDEQQSGIEAMQYGPGWGPEMDRAFGGEVIDADALEPAAKTTPSDFDWAVTAAKSFAATRSAAAKESAAIARQVKVAWQQMAHINREADDAARGEATEAHINHPRPGRPRLHLPVARRPPGPSSASTR